MKRSVYHVVVAVLLLVICTFLFPRGCMHEKEKRDSAASANAATEIAQFSSALKSYYVEYGKFLTGDNAAVVRGLRGDNPRKMVFIKLPASTLDDSGEFIDPWGHPYRVDLQNPKGPRVWSIGPDGRDAPDDPSSGDICSWR